MKIALIVAIVLTGGLGLNSFWGGGNGYLSTLADATTLWNNQGIKGNATYGPLIGACGPGPIDSFWAPIIPQIELAVKPSVGAPLYVSLSWTAMGNCAVRTSFQVGLSPGTYFLKLTRCSNATFQGDGCIDLSNATTVTVQPDVFTAVNIDAFSKLV